MIHIETDRLVIRTFQESDWQDLFDYLSDENVVRFEPYGVLSADQCKKEAKRRAADPAFRAVCIKATGKLIGNIYFAQEQPEQYRTWEIGYVFNASYHGNGYATESCKAVMNYAFDSLNARRIKAMCDPKNVRSWKLLERLNMRREGHFLEIGYFKSDSQGRPMWHDAYEYAILAHEWMQNR